MGSMLAKERDELRAELIAEAALTASGHLESVLPPWLRENYVHESTRLVALPCGSVDAGIFS